VKKKVLFICVQNSARSQMAAALLNETCGDYFEAQSAGLEPGVLNPLAVEALQERGIDISRNKTQSVFDVWKSAQHIFAYAITCAASPKQQGARFSGCDYTTALVSFRSLRVYWHARTKDRENAELLEEIRAKIEEFCEEHCELDCKPKSSRLSQAWGKS
jgi:arsenate reductase